MGCVFNKTIYQNDISLTLMIHVKMFVDDLYKKL